MKRLDALFLMAVVVSCSACENGFSKVHVRKAQIVDYETRTVGDVDMHITKNGSYYSDGVVVTLPSETTIKIVDIQQVSDEERNDLNYSLIKVTVEAEVDTLQYTGWVYISNVFFECSALERILKDTIEHELYAAYIVEHVDGIDQTLALRLMARMCESARVERDPDQRTYLFYLAMTYLFGVTDFDLDSCDTPPLNLAAKCDDAEFLSDIYGWCTGNNLPIDIPAGVSANTALIEAAIVGNPKCVEFLMMYGANAAYKNAKGKTAIDYMLASSNVALRNIAVYSRKMEDYVNALESLFSEDMRTVPDIACVEVPASVYIRFKKSGMSVRTTDYGDFLNELSVEEESGQATQSVFSIDVYPFDGYAHTDDGTRLNLRDSPSSTGKILGTVSDRACVQILSRGEKSDDIDDIIDYWYRIRDGKNEGWCFGGYLSRKIPIEDSSLRNQRGYGDRIPLEKGDAVYALSDCSLKTSRDETVAVRSFEPLEILAVCDPAFVSFGDSATSQYYLVEDTNNACGIVSGKYLSNDRFISDRDSNFEFYVVVVKTDEYIVTNRIFMRDINQRRCEEINFVMEETDSLVYGLSFFSCVKIVAIDACPYTIGGRNLLFGMFNCVNLRDDLGSYGRRTILFNIENYTAYCALSAEYSEYDDHTKGDMFSRFPFDWNDEDPSEITVMRYGGYNDNDGGDDSSATEDSIAETYTRDANDIFKYELSNEEQSDELPDK